jgi:hypothetical protein
MQKSIASPDKVTGYFNSNHTLLSNYVLLETESGKEFTVAKNLADPLMNAMFIGAGIDISEIELVDESTLPPMEQRLGQYLIDLSKRLEAEHTIDTVESAVSEFKAHSRNALSTFNYYLLNDKGMTPTETAAIACEKMLMVRGGVNPLFAPVIDDLVLGLKEGPTVKY